MTQSNYRWMVDAILFNLEDGSNTEAEAVAECRSLAQSQLLDFDYPCSKNRPLYDKVTDWCESHPPQRRATTIRSIVSRSRQRRFDRKSLLCKELGETGEQGFEP